ncbi:hypothetical protein [Radicibacter daui]|uniref:hypothetical protein n=1 Tax=Radicibacter daui TaxID=3064829 RepID=UPI004046B3CD
MSEKPASPVCYLAEAGDLYAGFAGRNELIAALIRTAADLAAISRAAHGLIAQTADPALKARARQVRDTGLRQRLPLRRILRQLGAVLPPAGQGGLPAEDSAPGPAAARLTKLDQAQAAQAAGLAQLAARIRDDTLCRTVLAVARHLAAAR